MTHPTPPDAPEAVRALLNGLRERKAILDRIISELTRYARMESSEARFGRRKAQAVMRMPNRATRKSA